MLTMSKRTHNLIRNYIFKAKPVKPTVECDMLHIPCLGIVMSLKNSTLYAEYRALHGVPSQPLVMPH